MTQEKIEFNEEKFKQVLHHLIHVCGSFENVGKTVLFKMLYFSDFNFYELHERAITGETYIKLPHGPAPSHFNEIIKQLKVEKKVREERRKYGGFPQQKFLCLSKPEKTLLDAEEMEMVDKVVSILCSFTASQVSAYSHGDMPWKATKDLQPIDYELAFYRDKEHSVREENEN